MASVPGAAQSAQPKLAIEEYSTDEASDARRIQLDYITTSTTLIQRCIDANEERIRHCSVKQIGNTVPNVVTGGAPVNIPPDMLLDTQTNVDSPINVSRTDMRAIGNVSTWREIHSNFALIPLIKLDDSAEEIMQNLSGCHKNQERCGIFIETLRRSMDVLRNVSPEDLKFPVVATV